MPTDTRGFTPEVFRRRRERALAALGSSAMVLPGASVRFSSRDNEYRFRPDSELFYLTGMDEPEAVAVLRGHAQEERFVLFVRPRDAKAELWSGPRLGPEDAKERYGADAAYPLAELEERLPGLLERAHLVYHRLGRDDRTGLLVRAALASARARGQRKGEGPRGVVDPGEVLDDKRLVKDEEEVRRLREAAAITVEGFRRTLRAARPGVGEWELEAVMDSTFRLSGADGPAYLTIVGSGPNACVLHYVANARALAEGDLVLVDAGAAVSLYGADITRTFPAGGTFSDAQREVYDVVERARAAAVAAVRPGATTADVHAAAVSTLAAGLVELGVLEGEVEALVGDEKHEAFYPHQTSHWLGLDVHDVGDYARDGEPRALLPGMVFTVEPGLYFPPAAEGVPARFAGIGVRIEDDVLVTEDGCEVLTAALPTAAEEVEALVGDAQG